MPLDTLETLPDSSWRPWAACHDLGPGAFFGRARKSLCASCPVAEPCLWAALALESILGYHYGIWGGTSAQRRERIAEQLGPVDYRAWYLGVIDRWTPPGPDVHRQPHTVNHTPHHCAPSTVHRTPTPGAG